MQPFKKRTYYNSIIEKQDYGTTTADPDVYGNKKRIKRDVWQHLHQQQQQVDDPDDVPFDDICFEAITEATLTASHLIDELMFAAEVKNRLASKYPRVCFVHQIYSLLRDNTAVDREIQQAAKAGAWRKFHILGTLDDEYLIMQTKDYLCTVEDAKRQYLTEVENGMNKDGLEVDASLFDRFGQLILGKRSADTTITTQSLLTGSSQESFSNKDITQLCKYGLLLPHMKKDSYWFAIRGQGNFMSSFLKGRTEILRLLKKRSTKDMLEKFLKTRKLRQTVFSHDFILHDLIGSGRVERHKTSMGDLIRLTKKGELG